MIRLTKKIVWLFILILFCSVQGSALEIENTADNPRLVNLTPQQYKALDTLEKRIYRTTFNDDNNIDRIERLELDYFKEIKQGSAAQRINSLKLASSRACIRGTAMTPMMADTFNSRYINQYSDTYYDDVGIIDGLLRLHFPDFYATLTEYRKYKEANFYK